MQPLTGNLECIINVSKKYNANHVKVKDEPFAGNAKVKNEPFAGNAKVKDEQFASISTIDLLRHKSSNTGTLVGSIRRSQTNI